MMNFETMTVGAYIKHVEVATGEKMEHSLKEFLRYLSTNKYCPRCGKENTIHWVYRNGTRDKMKFVIECADRYCSIAAYFGMTIDEYLREQERMREQDIIDVAEARAQRFKRPVTELDYAIERLFRDYIEAPASEKTNSDAYNEASEKFYGAHQKLMDRGEEFKELAHIFESESSNMSVELMNDAYERGFRDGMKYQSSGGTTEGKSDTAREYSRIA